MVHQKKGGPILFYTNVKLDVIFVVILSLHKYSKGETVRVTWGEPPSRGQTPHHDILELKLFWCNFFCSNYQTMCGQDTDKKQCSCYISLEKYRQKCVFRAFFSVFGFPFQITTILHAIMQFSIFYTHIER